MMMKLRLTGTLAVALLFSACGREMTNDGSSLNNIYDPTPTAIPTSIPTVGPTATPTPMPTPSAPTAPRNLRFTNCTPQLNGGQYECSVSFNWDPPASDPIGVGIQYEDCGELDGVPLAYCSFLSQTYRSWLMVFSPTQTRTIKLTETSIRNGVRGAAASISLQCSHSRNGCVVAPLP
jgi:hypothetical protein